MIKKFLSTRKTSTSSKASLKTDSANETNQWITDDYNIDDDDSEIENNTSTKSNVRIETAILKNQIAEKLEAYNKKRS